MNGGEKWAMPVAELERRRDGLLKWMDEAGVAVTVIIDAANLVYLSGIDIGGRLRGRAMVIAADGKHFFVTRSLERYWHEHWQTRTWCRDWALHEDTETLADALIRLAKSLCPGTIGRIGMDMTGLSPTVSFADAGRIAAVADDAVDTNTCLTVLRRIKSTPERLALRRAGEISMEGAAAAAAAIHDGASGAEATAAAFRAIVGCEGSQSPISGPHVTSGPRTAMAHSTWNHAKPADGDCVVFVMTGTCQRYSTPIEWTVTRGEPSPARADLLATCTRASEAVLDGLKPGMSSHDGDLLCRRVIEDAGVSKYFMNRTAYGIGQSYGSWMESLVQLKPGDDTEIEPGMTMHVVPALHVPGHGFLIRTLAIEVTQTGCQSLRPPPRFASVL